VSLEWGYFKRRDIVEKRGSKRHIDKHEEEEI